jgi:hypothetical protein
MGVSAGVLFIARMGVLIWGGLLEATYVGSRMNTCRETRSYCDVLVLFIRFRDLESKQTIRIVVVVIGGHIL